MRFKALGRCCRGRGQPSEMVQTGLCGVPCTLLCPAGPCQPPEPAAPSQRQSTGVQQHFGDTDFPSGSTFTRICTLVVPALALSTLPLILLAI